MAREQVLVSEPTVSPQLSDHTAVGVGSVEAASTLLNELWDLAAYQVELLSSHWLYALFAVLLSTLIFIYCRRARVKGRLLLFQWKLRDNCGGVRL